MGCDPAHGGRAGRVTFHFAYGSNMSRAVMRRHAAGAEPVGVATLANYRFLITTHGHASVAPRVISGRHASRNLSVRAALAPPHLARVVIGGLVALGALTVGLALLARADGADHPVTIASLLVAVIIVLGGPLLSTTARGRAARSAVPR